ncbi:hypothetical protein AXF42_Ash019097 [Apostasia shenzhenica]|uniref:TOG domain-containing protein n=1 Tax=Apostasia shenzhenica TaxID=1088818 RepID=A0A2I0AAA3_9ASPA|nr:hypothetical protein AXF42_Ash019097 [Apostasia shenzhenica]
MDGDRVNWDGLLKWSLAHSDGTASARTLSERDRQWFVEAMEANTVNVIKRMKEITDVMKVPQDILESQGVSTEDIEGSITVTGLLDELQEHVETIDMANDLHSIGGLVPLIDYLKNSHTGIRAKAEDVLTTVVQNNPKSQQLVMEASGLEPLMFNLTTDPDSTVRAKALGAISSLIRNNKPGTTAFKLANGYAALRDALSSDNTRFQRKALNLIHYLLQESPSDCSTVTDLGFPRLLVNLASNDDSGVREGALSSLVELARDQTSAAASSLTSGGSRLKQILENRIDSVSNLDAAELAAAREERQLLDSLWSACYSSPSALREKGLLVLPGEENPEQPPDVAGPLFEPPLRAWAAAKNTAQKEEQQQKNPLLLGAGPSGSDG